MATSTITDLNSQIDHLRFKYYSGLTVVFNNSSVSNNIAISSIDPNLANAKMLLAYRASNFFQCTTNNAKNQVALHVPEVTTGTYTDVGLLAIF